MEPLRKEKSEPEPEADVLRDIAADARRLKDRYLDDTVVPEGGE